MFQKVVSYWSGVKKRREGEEEAVMAITGAGDGAVPLCQGRPLCRWDTC